MSPVFWQRSVVYRGDRRGISRIEILDRWQYGLARRRRKEGGKGNERRWWREGSRVRHSTSWHSRLARMFRMVSLLDLSSRPRCIPSPRVSSWIRHAVLRAPWGPRETTEREREREREEEPCAVWHGSCSRFSESLISVLLVLFPCRARPLPENPCPRLASPFLPPLCHPCVWRVPLTISSRILEWRCSSLEMQSLLRDLWRKVEIVKYSLV